MATIDFGWALRTYITATNSAREGARLGVTGATRDQVTGRTVDSSSGLLSSADVTVTNVLGTPGDALTVSVTFDYRYITPLGGLLNLISGGELPDPLPISTSTTMRLE